MQYDAFPIVSVNLKKDELLQEFIGQSRKIAGGKIGVIVRACECAHKEEGLGRREFYVCILS